MTIDASVPKPTAADLERINGVLREFGGPHVSWGAKEPLDIWVIEQRAKQDAAIAEQRAMQDAAIAEQRAKQDAAISRRLLIASWALVAATVALCVVTIGLVVAH